MFTKYPQSYQKIEGLRNYGPNSVVTIKDLNGKVLRIETPAGQLLTIFKKPKRRVHARINVKGEIRQ